MLGAHAIISSDTRGSFMTGVLGADNSIVMSWCLDSDGDKIEGSGYNKLLDKPDWGRGTFDGKDNHKTQAWEVSEWEGTHH
jgi:hypothetical protein